MQWFELNKSSGFRLNLSDILFIIALCGISYFIYSIEPTMNLHRLPLYLGFSFFCFCNIFRIGNRLEALWYVPFCVITAYYLCFFEVGLLWKLILYALEPWKWILIVYHIIWRPYYGLGYKWVNQYKKIKQR